MTRYFYDNAIDALYMAEKFGVKYLKDTLVGDGWAKFWTTESNYSFCSPDVSLRTTIHSDVIFYIAPESLEIFDPREGDFIAFGTGGGVDFGHYCSDIRKERVLEIIQRNNTPFITPKSEEDDE